MAKRNCYNDYGDCYDEQERRRKRKLKLLGDLTRGAYLGENPHGYKRTKKVHKNKAKYSRKGRNRKLPYY